MSGTRSRGISAIRQWFKYGPIIDRIYKSILAQKTNKIALADFLSEAKADETIDEADILYRFFEREVNDQFSIPTDDIKDVLKMLEDRRQVILGTQQLLLQA